jgi:hypothetical protein
MVILPSMVEYSNEAIKVSISAPSGWTIETSEENQFRLFGPLESGFEEYFDEYRCTMSYILGEPEDSTQLNWFETLVRDSQQEIAEEYNAYELIRESHHEIFGRPAYLHYFEWTEENLNLRLSQLQSLIQANDLSFYLINAAALKPLDEKYMPIFTAILNSTKILP